MKYTLVHHGLEEELSKDQISSNKCVLLCEKHVFTYLNENFVASFMHGWRLQTTNQRQCNHNRHWKILIQMLAYSEDFYRKHLYISKIYHFPLTKFRYTKSKTSLSLLTVSKFIALSNFSNVETHFCILTYLGKYPYLL